MKIKIRDGLEIGDGCPPFIICEVGSNWCNLDNCLMSIEKAKECGADAVKFQLFNRRALYGMSPGDYTQTSGLRIYASRWVCSHAIQMAGLINGELGLTNGELPIEWLPKLKEKADAVGIEFMCSAFSPELIDAVDPFVNVHKVASAECTHKRMLERLRKIGKPVFLSTGAHELQDVKAALSVLDNTPTVLLYCVAAYPARSVNLWNVPFMKEAFKTLVGYSDHTTDSVTIPDAAIKTGACVIEKHVTFIDAKTPDSPHSLSTKEFKNMVSCIRTGQESELLRSKEEEPMILRHNRRLIAVRDIKIGDELKENYNFGIYRSLKDAPHAFSPFMIDEVNGKPAKRDIKAGDGIGLDDA